MAGFGKAEFAQPPWGDTRSRYSGCRAMNGAMNAHRGTTVRPSARTASSTPLARREPMPRPSRAEGTSWCGGGEPCRRPRPCIRRWPCGRPRSSRSGARPCSSRFAPWSSPMSGRAQPPGTAEDYSRMPEGWDDLFLLVTPGSGITAEGLRVSPSHSGAAPGLHDHLGSAAYGTIGGHRFRLAPAEASPGSESGAGLAGTALGRRGAAPARAQAAAGSGPQRVTITGVPTLTRL